MRYLTAGLIALYLLCAGGIAATFVNPEMVPWVPFLLMGKLAAIVVALVAGILFARPRWTWPTLAVLAASTAAIPYPLYTGIAAATVLAGFLLWRMALSRRASLALVVTSYSFALLALLLPRLQPGVRFNVMMVLFIVLFILFAGVVAALFTWLFIKVFEALDGSFAYSFLYLLPLLGAPTYLLARVFLPWLPELVGSPLYPALALALDAVLALGLLLLFCARLLGRRLGPRHFVPLVAWKLLRSQRLVPTAKTVRLLRVRELVPQGKSARLWPPLVEIIVVVGLATGATWLANTLVASSSWISLARSAAFSIAAALLMARFLSTLGRWHLATLISAVALGTYGLVLIDRATIAGETAVPLWLAPALGVIPLALLLVQMVVRAVLGRLRQRGRLPARLDPRLAPSLETRVKEGVGASVFVSVVGVAIGVWALIVVLSVMGGFSGEMQDRIVRTKDHLMIKAEDRDAGIPRALDLAQSLTAVDGVASASVYLEAEAMMSSSSNISATVTVRGIDRTPSALAFLRESLVAGSTQLFRYPENLVSFPELTPLPYLGESGESFWTPTALADEAGGGLSPEPDALAPMLGETGLEQLPGFPELANDQPAEVSERPPDEEDLPELAGAPGLIAMPAIGDEDVATDSSGGRPYLGGSGQHVLPPIIIGQELARSLGGGVGSRITVISPDGDVGPMGVQPKARAFRIAAVFSTGMYEYDLKLAYMYLPDASRFFSLSETIDHIDVRLVDLHRADAIRTNMLPLLADAGVEVMTWQEMNRNLFSALKLERVVMFIVLGFIILIASFNIIASLIIIIRKRLAAIAILRTLGASSGEVTRIFFMLGSAAGLFGIASGVLMGLSSCGIIEHLGLTLPREYYIRSLPVAVDGWQVTQIALAAFLITALAARYPGRLAARVQLVEGLKDER
jgi:lipoprotein-releasing system permease protein